MNMRDFEYIENRLMAPGVDAMDAAERLEATGYPDLAKLVVDAVADLTTKCREVRVELIRRGALNR